MTVGEMFLACADAAIEMIGAPELEEVWSEDSALHGLTVGGLAAHLGSAIVTAELFLATEPPADLVSEPTDAAGFFLDAMAAGNYRSGLDSEIQTQIRRDSEEFGALGQVALVDTVAACLDRIRVPVLESPDRLIVTFADIVLPVEEYLGTRVIELVAHGDDLAASVAGVYVAPPEDAARYVARVLADVAIRHHGPMAAIRALARAERSAGPLVAF